MDFMKSIAIFIAGILARRVVDALMVVAPFGQAVVDVILIGVDQAARRNGLGDDGLDRRLLHVGQHTDNHFAIALDQSQHGRFLTRQGSTSALAFQPPPASGSTFLGNNIWAALVPRHDIHFVGFNFARQAYRLFLTSMPSRSCVVIACASPMARSNSAAICSLDKFKPMKYRHNTQTRRG
jgi:hypothetical protein